MRGFDPEITPQAIFWVGVAFYLLFLLVTALGMRGNAREARSPRKRCRSAACEAGHPGSVGVAEPSSTRAVDHLAIRRSLRAAAYGFAAGAVAAVLLWFPLSASIEPWRWPYSFTGYLWWTLPLACGAAANWTVMLRSRREPLTRSS